MTQIFSLQGRVALVTGASRGLGFAMAQGLAQAGALVVLNGRDAATLALRRADIEAAGGQAEIAAFDVCDRLAADAAMDAILARHGRLDILINNAAFGVPRDFFDISDDDWRLSLNVALDSCFRLSRKAAAGMVAQGWGRIIMISSVNARIGRATNTPYITAKAGLEGLARGMATELASRGVTVNCIAPGYMATDINTKFREQPGQYEWIRNRTPMKRWGAPEDLMGAAVFLASEASAFMTGQVMVIDGGMTVAI
ncbi:gluconate 5-dehydrogenase [Comamonadaceae bacterium]|nr:gluconate 5-dehydrogenase [Comamonadaceae bacterium]